MSLDGPAGPPGPDAGPGRPTNTACGYPAYEEGATDETYPKTGADATGVERRIWDELYGVEDPEMPVSVVDLGLIYDVEVADGHAHVEMTLTYSGCPARDMLQGDVHAAAVRADGVESAEVSLRYSPAWNVSMVTQAGRESLREFGLSV